MHRSKIAFLGVIDIELFPLLFRLSYAVSRVPEVEGITCIGRAGGVGGFRGSLALQEYCVGFFFHALRLLLLWFYDLVVGAKP